LLQRPAPASQAGHTLPSGGELAHHLATHMPRRTTHKNHGYTPCLLVFVKEPKTSSGSCVFRADAIMIIARWGEYTEQSVSRSFNFGGFSANVIIWPVSSGLNSHQHTAKAPRPVLRGLCCVLTRTMSAWGYLVNAYRLSPRTLQSGKKVPDTIFDVCPLVALLLGLKYGRSPGGMHGSPVPPHG